MTSCLQGLHPPLWSLQFVPAVKYIHTFIWLCDSAEWISDETQLPVCGSIKTPNSSLTLQQNNEITAHCFLCSDHCSLNQSWHIIYPWMRERKINWHLVDMSSYYPSSLLYSLQIENKNNNHRAGKLESLCLSWEWRQRNNDEAEIDFDRTWRPFVDPLMAEPVQQETKPQSNARLDFNTSQGHNLTRRLKPSPHGYVLKRSFFYVFWPFVHTQAAF